MAPQLVATFSHLVTLRSFTLEAIRGILSLIYRGLRPRLLLYLEQETVSFPWQMLLCSRRVLAEPPPRLLRDLQLALARLAQRLLQCLRPATRGLWLRLLLPL